MLRLGLIGFCAAALIAVVSAPMPAHAADALSTADRAQIEQIIHDYLVNHPEVLIDALKAAEAKARADQEDAARAALKSREDDILRDPTSPVGGNPKGDVTIVEFFDYRCPYCKQVEPAIETLLKEDLQVRVVYKEFPILGPDSVTAARVALAAAKQGPQQYARFHSAMMSTKGQINESVIMKVAQDSGLDMAKVKADMKSPEVEAIIQRNYALADVLDIKGTPAFIVGDKVAPGAIDVGELRKMVAAARNPG